MFIGTGTNNDLRKLRQERHGTSSAAQSDMSLLTELGSRAGCLSYKHAAPDGAMPDGPPPTAPSGAAWNLVCCPIRHAAPDGAWFSGGAPQL